MAASSRGLVQGAHRCQGMARGSQGVLYCSPGHWQVRTPTSDATLLTQGQEVYEGGHVGEERGPQLGQGPGLVRGCWHLILHSCGELLDVWRQLQHLQITGLQAASHTRCLDIQISTQIWISR